MRDSFFYIDNRLDNPHAMPAMIMCFLNYGHPGRDAMLGVISDIWRPNIHREVVGQVRLCEQCLLTGKNLKCVLEQKQIGKLLATEEKNEVISLYFAGLFQKARHGTKDLVVS